MNSYNASRFLKCLLLVLALAIAGSFPAHAREALLATGIKPPQSVLFVGNSFTFYNNAIYTHLRKLLVAEDASNRRKIFLKSMTTSGAMLSDHSGGLKQLLASRDWDIVVLQGQSREPVDDETAAGFQATALKYTEAIRAKGAEPVLFMTWAYADQPEMTHELSSEFKRLGRMLGVAVIPVGLAFERAIEDIPGVALYDPDQRHPSLQGTYLAAAVFYAAFYGRSPVALGYDAGLDETTARQLRQAAWQTVIEYYPDQ